MTNFLRGTYIVVVEKYLMKQVFGSLKGCVLVLRAPRRTQKWSAAIFLVNACPNINRFQS
jgi:hypothetical protein